MKKIFITDKTLALCALENVSLSFREKTEIAKELDNLGIDTIELPAVSDKKTDILLIKNIAGLVKNTAVNLITGLSCETVDLAFDCIKNAVKPVLNVAVPTSVVQMEYVCRLKPDKLLEKISETVSYSKTLCENIEFTAVDATRAERDFLYNAITVAVKAGANSITLCDSAGTVDGEDFSRFIKDVYKNVDGLSQIRLCVDVSDAIDMATACIASAIKNGVSAIKTTVGNYGYAQLEKTASFFAVKGEAMGVAVGIKRSALNKTCKNIKAITSADRTKVSPYSSVVRPQNENIEINKNDCFSYVSGVIKKIGYELEHEDMSKVYEEVKRILRRKENMGAKELEAVIATVAMQVPSTYNLISYVINSGNIINSTANIHIEKNGENLNGVYAGDGPIDASFLALEQVIGRHFELDDFQIQSVTEGREAMGQALVKLRSTSGRLYSGSGISTDIIGASIRAYINALNKMIFEENKK